MRNFSIVLSLIILATLLACTGPSQESAAPTLRAPTIESRSAPSEQLTMAPTVAVASVVPTLGAPTEVPTSEPIQQPTMAPTATVVIAAPTLGAPTEAPTSEPVQQPTAAPTTELAPTPTENTTPSGPTWRGIAVASEHRCSPYNSDDYPYPASVEPKIVAAQGGIYGPYTGTWFDSIKETDIEHIVARSEAHDSGLCAASPAMKAKFASDLLNLTLASPSVNRHQKVANDASEWLPDLNQCWYVARTIQVRQAYELTIDRAEADAIDQVLAQCSSTEMVVLAPTQRVARPTPTNAPAGTGALAMYDDNGNGRITCAEARAHGIAPVRRGHPAYQYMRDADGDGIVCE